MSGLKKLIPDEPMLFSASLEFAKQQGGPLTRRVLKMLPSDLSPNTVIDTRVHMLKPGWYPAIPGWHLDAIPRGPNGQPILDHPQRSLMKHWLYTLDDGTGSLTGTCNASIVELSRLPVGPGENVWAVHSAVIRRRLKSGSMYIKRIASDDLTCLPADRYHTAMPATGHGWRFFFRASENTLHSGPHNEIRKQVQVYVPSADSGW